MSAADWVVLSLIALLTLWAYYLRRRLKSSTIGAKATKPEHIDPALEALKTQILPLTPRTPGEPGISETAGGKAAKAEHLDPELPAHLAPVLPDIDPPCWSRASPRRWVLRRRTQSLTTPQPRLSAWLDSPSRTPAAAHRFSKLPVPPSI